MAGILDFDPQTQGLLQAAFAGLQASGPSRMPVSTGQVLGQAGSAGLAGYDQAAKLQSALGLQDIETKLKKAQLDKAISDLELQKQLMAGGLTAGGVGGILNNPDMMEAVGTKLSLASHPGGAALVNAAGHRRKQMAEEAQFGTMKSPAPDQISSLGAGDLLPSTEGKAFTNPDVQTVPLEERGLFDAALNKARATNVAARGEGGIFGSLINSPIPQIAAQARAAQTALNAQPTAASVPPQHWLDIANRLATQEATLVSREQNLAKSEHVLQDKDSPTGWSYEDTRTGKITKGAPPPPSSAAIPGDVIPPEHKDLHGDDYLQTLPTGRAALLKQIAEGKQGLNVASMRYGNKEVLSQQLAQYDPSYTQARKGVWDDFTKGKSAQNATAINTVIAHAGTVSDLTDALKNRDLRLANALINRFRTETGKPEINNAETAIQAMGNEMMRVFRQVNASEQETKEWESRFNAAKNSPAQLKGALQTGATLLVGRIDALKDQFDRGMDNAGREKAGLQQIDFTILSPQSQMSLSKLGVVRKDVPLTEGQAPALAAAPTQRRRYNPATGRIE